MRLFEAWKKKIKHFKLILSFCHILCIIIQKFTYILNKYRERFCFFFRFLIEFLILNSISWNIFFVKFIIFNWIYIKCYSNSRRRRRKSILKVLSNNNNYKIIKFKSFILLLLYEARQVSKQLSNLIAIKIKIALRYNVTNTFESFEFINSIQFFK